MHDTATPRLAISMLFLRLMPDDANMRDAYKNKLDFIVKNSLYTYENLLYELSDCNRTPVEFIDKLVLNITEGRSQSPVRYVPFPYDPSPSVNANNLNNYLRSYADTDTEVAKALLNGAYGLGYRGGLHGR